jgi:monoamine oxidase
MQSDSLGSFTVFAGGKIIDEINKEKEAVLVNKYLPALDAIYPGAAKAYSGTNVKFCWSKYPFVQAGYSSFRKGQWSTLAGWEGEPVGNIFFAGEHVSLDFQGYMNGAAKTGKKAANQIREKISAEQAVKQLGSISLALGRNA